MRRTCDNKQRQCVLRKSAACLGLDCPPPPPPVPQCVLKDPCSVVRCAAGFQCVVENYEAKCKKMEPKPGTCPINDLLPVILCPANATDHCSNDFECPSGQKCCSYGCKLNCVSACVPACGAGEQCVLPRQPCLGADCPLPTPACRPIDPCSVVDCPRRLSDYRPARCSSTARCWRKLDVAEAGRLLQCVDWSPVFESTAPEAQWDYFVKAALPIIDNLAPAKRFKARNPTAPPVTEVTKELMARRRAALRSGDRPLYKELNRRVRAAIRRDTSEEIHRRILASGRSSMWRTIRPVISAKQPTTRVGTVTARQVDTSGPELPVRLARVSTGRFVVRTLSAPEAVETPASEPERVTESPLSPDGKQTETSAGPPAVTPGQAQCDRGDDESVPNSTGNMVMESWRG
ncbi:hypothetical protein FJT64_024084 [Amphibalanus amphitrite]|uniref:WAP domain-containing protein n=1 Tax=Amphibalanus amphitrite TaxID=1232801 RepID=A0A6A4WJZ2_AMPAM|nr:hypothetical protein FJT64_024084 [Amphibalanus amphitrite]